MIVIRNAFTKTVPYMNIKLILRITCINFVLSRIACQFITRVIAIKLLHVRTLYPSTRELAIQI